MSVNSKQIVYFLTFFIVLFILVVVYYIYLTKKPVWETKRSIRYVFTLENKSSKPKDGVVFKTYSPLLLSSTQKLVGLQSNQKFIKANDVFGNQILSFEIGFIAPYAKKKITVTAEMMLSSVAAGERLEHELYLSEQPKIEIHNNKIIKIAEKLKNQNGDLHKNIFHWLVENIEYSGYGMRDRGAVYALENLKGDCTEYAYLNVAINRILKFPSRAVNGYIVDHDKKLNATEYHTWSEVWMNGGWQVVDAQKNNYLTNQQNYIGMNIVTTTDTKKQQFKRFWVSHPELIITMK